MDREMWDALAAGYGVLGRLHRQAPVGHELDTLRGMVDEWPLPHTDSAQAGMAAWRESSAQGETAREVAADHNRLYGVTARALVAPYESVHRGDDGLVFDEETLQVREAYRELGLRVPLQGREPDDHLGLEFDFMAQALNRAVEAAEPHEPLRMAQAFCDDHLLAWAPTVLAQVEELSTTRFMAGVALLSMGTLASTSAAFA